MSDRRSAAESGPNLESALSGFPFPERDWEQAALSVLERVSRTELGSTDAALLVAPLPSELGEPASAPSATATPLSNSGVRSQSLAELARRTVANTRAAEREIARASLALAAQQRPSPEQASVLREALSLQQRPKTPESRSAAVLPVPAPGFMPASAGSLWPKLGLAAFALALAAGMLFGLRQTTLTPLTSTAAPTPARVGDAKPKEAASAGPVAEAALPGVNASSLPKEPAARAAREREPAAGAAARPVTASAAPPGAATAALLKPPRSLPPANAEQAVAKTLPPDPALRPADSTGGEVPAKPSSGAVQAALGAVLSGARHCVAGSEAPSSATVVFASDGHVRSVAVSGPASGKSSGSCIEAQLGRARVQPFAAPSFSVSATVRPD